MSLYCGAAHAGNAATRSWMYPRNSGGPASVLLATDDQVAVVEPQYFVHGFVEAFPDSVSFGDVMLPRDATAIVRTLVQL